MKAETLPEKYKRHRRIFWLVYLGSIGFIIGMTMLIMLLIVEWRELVEELATMRAEDLLLLFVIFFVYSIPFAGFFRCMRAAQEESLARYWQMTEKEQRAIDRVQLGEMKPGEIFYTDSGFLFRDKRRLFFWNILTYDEIIWAYLAESFYQITDMEKMIMTPMMRFRTLVLMERDGRKHSIFMADYKKLLEMFSSGTILGYGREQKRQVKELRGWYAEYDSSLLADRRKGIRKNIGVAAVTALLAAACVSVYAFLESDYYEYLRILKKADAAYAAGEYFDAWEYYRWAGELKPDSDRVDEGQFLSFLGSTREGVEEGWLSDVEGDYRILLEWRPENGELYLEAAEAELTIGEPMTAIAFLDMGIAAWEEGTFTEAEAARALFGKRVDILSRIRVESLHNYWAESGMGGVEKLYDEAGNQTESVIYDQEGTESYRTVYVYDERGNCVEERYYDRGEPDGRVAYAYDAAGSQTAMIFYDNADDVEREFLYAYEYDAYGNVTCYKEWHNGWLNYWDEYAYDENGNTIWYAEKDSDGVVLYTERTAYDENGNETADYLYDGDGVLYWWSESTYEEDGAGGTVVERISYFAETEAEPKVTRKITWLDASGNQIKYIVYDFDGNETNGEYMEYDESGHKTYAARSRRGEVYEECEYSYDASGNLLLISTYETAEDGRSLENQSSYCYDVVGNELAYHYVTYDSSGGVLREWVKWTEYRYVYEAENYFHAYRKR